MLLKARVWDLSLYDSQRSNKMKKILGIAGLALAFSGTAAAADLGLSYDLSNILAPAGASTSMGASYYLDDSSELMVGIDMALEDGDFALNAENLGYFMHGDGDGIHSLMHGGISITDATGDMGLSLMGGVGFQSDLSFFDNASVRAWTGLSIDVMPDVAVASVSSNLALHYKFGM
jgi:hypothetical protein